MSNTIRNIVVLMVISLNCSFAYNTEIDTARIFRIQDSILKTQDIFLPDSLISRFQIFKPNEEGFFPDFMERIRYDIPYDSNLTYLILSTEFRIGIIDYLNLSSMIEIDLNSFEITNVYFKQRGYLFLKNANSFSTIKKNKLSAENLLKIVKTHGEIEILNYSEQDGRFHDSLTNRYNDWFRIDSDLKTSTELNQDFYTIDSLNNISTRSLIVFEGGDYSPKYVDGCANVHLYRQHQIHISISTMKIIYDGIISGQTHVVVCPSFNHTPHDHDDPPPPQIKE